MWEEMEMPCIVGLCKDRRKERVKTARWRKPNSFGGRGGRKVKT